MAAPTDIQPCTVCFTAKTSVDLLPWLSPAWEEVLISLRNFLNMDRPEHHSTACLKERGMENRSNRHSTLQDREWSCSPGKHWHYFEGNLGKTAEKQGGVRMDLSEHYHAILKLKTGNFSSLSTFDKIRKEPRTTTRNVIVYSILSPRSSLRSALTIKSFVGFTWIHIEGSQPEWCISTIYHV